MSWFNVEDLKLEQNIRLKELELLRILEETHNQAVWNISRTSRYLIDSVYDSRMNFSSAAQPIVRSTSVVSHHQIIQAPFAYWNGISNLCQSNMEQGKVPPNLSLDMARLDNKAHVDFKHGDNIEYRSAGIIFPVYSNKASLPDTKKLKNNKKKSFYSSRTCSQANNDYSNVVVTLQEIGLGYPRAKTVDDTSLIAQFRRMYIYLTSLCKERKLLESVIYAQEYTFNTKYILPANVNVAGHFEYALKTLSVEIKFVETIIHNIQQRCEDSMLMKLWQDQTKNLLEGMNVLTILNGANAARDLCSKDAILKVKDTLDALIKSVRYLGIIYTITAQKLLIKEAVPYGLRRRAFIGR